MKPLTVLFIALLFSGFVTTLPVLGQSKQEKHAQKVADKLRKLGTGEEARVKVKLYSGTTYEGFIKESSAADFVLVDRAGGSNTVEFADVKSIGGKNVSTGVKIAVGIGIGIVATIALLTVIAFSALD